MENGYRIKVALTDMESHAVDVPEDLEKLKY
jgi:3-deoxy-manno-octulosonate cytidylyltransferase (CMP-KDO synthetase)